MISIPDSDHNIANCLSMQDADTINGCNFMVDFKVIDACPSQQS